MSRYTRRNYNEIAEIIKLTRKQMADATEKAPYTKTGANAALDIVTAKLSRLFSDDNGRFNPEQFKSATEG